MSRYSNREVLEFVETLQQMAPVESWTIADVHIWPIIRNSIPFNVLQNIKKDSDSKDKNTSKFCWWKKLRVLFSVPWTLFFLFFRLLGHLVLAKKDSVIILSDGASRVKLDRFYDKICCPLDELICTTKQVQSIRFSQVSMSEKRLKKRYFSLELCCKMAYFIARFLVMFLPKNHTLEGFDLIESELQKKNMYNFSYRHCCIFAMQVRVLATLFGLYIRWKRVKACYMVCYYGTIGYALNYAARKHNITAYDMQHGSIENCPGYYYWSNVPSEDYNVLPHTFYFWDAITLDIFNTYNGKSFVKQHRGEVFGLPMLLSHTFKQMIDAQSEEIQTIKAPYSRMIFVPLQPQFQGRLDWDILSEQIKKSDKNWLWWIRPHPSYIDSFGFKKIMELQGYSVFYDPGTFSIYSIYKATDYIVSTASSTVAEAKLFDRPSVLISPTGLEDFEYYIEHDLVASCDSKHVLDFLKEEFKPS